MEDALKYSLIPLASIFLLGSCAWYRDLERSLVDEDDKKGKRSQTVPRSQYDQLLVKYEELSKKYEMLKERPASSQGSLVDEIQQSKTENFATTSDNAETVDVFKSNANSSVTNLDIPEDIESQLSLYRKAMGLRVTNPGEATKIFQQLEIRAIAPVQVRAKYQVGEMLLEKNQYDLALQVFEDIINKYANSGVVLHALKGAVAASEKLGVPNKRDQYASMLNDVFGEK
jgi:TolA-binding protein